VRDRRWLILAVLFAARAATGFQFQSVGSATKMLMQSLGLDYSQVGMLIGAYLLPGVVVAFPAGLLGERFREKTLGIIGLALMLASGLALADASGLATALVARMAGGAGATIIVLVATKMTTDWFDGREIVLAMSLLQLSWPFGAMLALPSQAFIAQFWGWPAVMLSGGLCAGAALCAFAAVAQPAAEEKPTAVMHEKLPAAILLPVTVAGVAWGAMNLACILFFSYAPLLMTARGLAPTAAASLTSLAVWLTIVAIPSGGYLVHRLGRPIAAIVVCALIGAFALAQFVVGVGPTTACLLFGVAVGPLSGAMLSLPAKILEPRHRSFGFGVFYTCFYVLMAVGPLVAGHLQDAWASPAAALIAGAALLVAVAPLSLAFAALTRPRRFVERHGMSELRAAAPDGA
jgi:predicted MFS family arabinose efflux permease